MSIQTIKNELSKLSKAEQAEIIHFMVGLLANPEEDIPNEWKSEIDKREESLKNGRSVGKSAREVLAKYISK